MKLFSLFSTLDLKTGDFQKKLDSASVKATQFQHKLQNAMTAAAKTTAAVTAAIGGVVTALGAKLATTGFTYNTQIENYTANFRSLLGSVEAAEQRVEELKQKAAATPFGLADLADATQTLLSFQVDADKTNEILSRLGDIALGNKEKLSSLALVFGQVSSAGKLTGQDLMQFINSGFNPLNAIVERTGESMEQVRNRMSAGKIGIEEVMQAIRDVTDEGGLFYGGTEEAAKTTTGLWSTLSDNWSEFWGKIMEPVNTAAREKVLPSLIENLGKLSNAIFGVNEAEKKLFVDSEGNAIDPSQNLRTWLSDLMTVWTDGKEEDNTIVESFVNDFKANTNSIQNALVERIQSGALSDEEFAQAQRDLEEISRMQGEVEKLLHKRQNGTITAEEEQRLGQMVLALETMQTRLAGANATEKALSPWERFISTVADLAVEKIDSLTNWLIAASESGELGDTFNSWIEGIGDIASAFEALYTILRPVADIFGFISDGWDTTKSTIDRWINGETDEEKAARYAEAMNNETAQNIAAFLNGDYYREKVNGEELTVADLVSAPPLEWFNSNGGTKITNTEELAAAIVSAQPSQEISINIDGEAIAHATVKYLDKEQKKNTRSAEYGLGMY